MSKKYHVERREFLNKFTDMRAYVIGIVEDTREQHTCCDSKKDRSEIILKIADCSDEIDLWFDLRSGRDRENSPSQDHPSRGSDLCSPRRDRTRSAIDRGA